jgi:phage gpG-like protein
MAISMKIFGVTAVEDLLNGAMSAVGNMKPALELVARDLMEVIDINFGSQGRRGGGSWKQLNPETLARKVREGELPLILIATSALRDSMTLYRDPNMDLRVTRDFIELSSRLDYANVQDRGGGPSDLPARPYADFLQSDVDHWAEICAQYLTDAMRVGRSV